MHLDIKNSGFIIDLYNLKVEVQTFQWCSFVLVQHHGLTPVTFDLGSVLKISSGPHFYNSKVGEVQN